MPIARRSAVIALPGRGRSFTSSRPGWAWPDARSSLLDGPPAPPLGVAVSRELSWAGSAGRFRCGWSSRKCRSRSGRPEKRSPQSGQVVW